MDGRSTAWSCRARDGLQQQQQEQRGEYNGTHDGLVYRRFAGGERCRAAGGDQPGGWGRRGNPATAGGAAGAAGVAVTPSGAKPADAAPDDQQKLTVNLGAEPETLDWQVSEFEQDIAVEHLLARGLFFFDSKVNLVPGLAAQIPTKENGGISADALTYTIKMKPGQKFSDGNLLTAKDMEYSIKRMLDPKVAGNYAGFFYDLKGGDDYNNALGTKDQPKNPSDQQLQQLRDAVGVKAVDDQTIQFP